MKIVLALAACVFALGACSPHEPPRSSQAGSPRAYRETPIGLCEDYPPESTSADRLTRDFALLASLGVRVLRVSFGWDDLEPEPGKYVFAQTDEFVALAVDRHGLQLIPYVAYTPAWAARNKGPDAWKSPPEDPRRFGELLQRLAQRYAGKIKSWELWNEPDNGDFFSGDSADYAALLKEGALGVRRGDANARVVLGGLADDLAFLRRVLGEHRSAPYVDIVNLHRYPETWSNDSLESVAPFIAEARDIVDSVGEGEPLWMAEVGYSSFRRGTHVSNWFEAVYDYEHTPRFQGVALGRIVTTALSTEQLSLLAWYEVSDLPSEGEVIGDVNNRHLGILSADGTPKPALAAFRTVARLFSGQLRALRSELDVDGVARDQVALHGFQKPDDSIVLAAWLKTLGPERARAKAGQDPRRATVHVTLPVSTAARRATLYDSEGRTLAASVGVEDRVASTRLTGIGLSGGELVFVELAGRSR